jgi:TonB family protein
MCLKEALMKQFPIVFCVGALLFAGGLHCTDAFAQNSPDVLSAIPLEFEPVFVLNVPQMVQSPLYSRIQREQQQPLSAITNSLIALSKSTGLDLARDVSSLVMAGWEKGRVPLMIAAGSFEEQKIRSYMQSMTSPVTQQYKGTELMISPTAMGIAFLDRKGIAYGDLEQLRALVDARAGARKSIMSNPEMASLISVARTDETLWFVGLSDVALQTISIPLSLAGNPLRNEIQSLTGAVSITDAIVGKVAVTVKNPESAVKIAEMMGKNALSAGITIDQEGRHIGFSLNFGLELLDKLASANAKSLTSKRDVKQPVPVFQPMPPYTDEAKKAGIEGNIALSVIIRKDGTPERIRVIKGLGYGLDESAVKTVMGWRFMPALVDGEPVEMQAGIQVTFRLPGFQMKQKK